MAAQAEYVAYLAQSLAELVEFELEYLKFYNVEVSNTGRSDVNPKAGAVSIHAFLVPISHPNLICMIFALFCFSRY